MSDKYRKSFKNYRKKTTLPPQQRKYHKFIIYKKPDVENRKNDLCKTNKYKETIGWIEKRIIKILKNPGFSIKSRYTRYHSSYAYSVNSKEYWEYILFRYDVFIYSDVVIAKVKDIVCDTYY